jgi:hypothetical protein
MIVPTEKGLTAAASLIEPQGKPHPNAQETNQGKGARFTDAAGTAGTTDHAAAFDRAFRSIVIPPRPAAKKPTANRG